MLVGRPTGPGTVASPGQPGNQAGSLNLLVERHKNLSLPHALSALRDSYQAVILQSFGVGGVPGGGSGPFARAMEDWLRAGKTIVMMTQVPYEGSDMAVYQVGYQVKEKYQLMEAYNMTLEAAATKLMWVLGQTRDSEEVRRLFYQPAQWDIIR